MQDYPHLFVEACQGSKIAKGKRSVSLDEDAEDEDEDAEDTEFSTMPRDSSANLLDVPSNQSIRNCMQYIYIYI